jgi:hypothetical protein
MPKKLERCVDKVKKEGKTDQAAYAICNAAIKDSLMPGITFTDKITYDSESRRIISMRDGVQKYYGAELGMEPVDKVFLIYRGPETVRAAAGEMTGLPMTDEHVSLDAVPQTVIGKVINARVQDFLDEETNTTVAVENKVNLDAPIDKREFSLGYHADLVPCDLYDFEQVDIIPHHLAVVDRGRCGRTCTFKDGEETMPKEISKAFLDANGEINMQQVLTLVNDLPEAIKTLPLKELQKLVPALTKAVELAAGEMATEAVSEVTEGEETMASEEEPPVETSVEVEDEKDMEKEKVETTDTEPVPVTDTAEFVDALAGATRTYAEVVDKARNFLPETYSFGDKTATQIMADAVATQHKEKFNDSELSTAFKLLKKVASYQNFGDAKPGLAALADKEI